MVLKTLLISCTTLSVIVNCVLLYDIIMKRRKLSKVKNVLLFSNNNLGCTEKHSDYSLYEPLLGTQQSCDVAKNRFCLYRNMRYLTHELHSANHTIDVCYYTLSLELISNLFVDKHESGVLVRIITDQEIATEEHSLIRNLRNKGIPVKVNEPVERTCMHHKFIIIDGTVLITGSANLTHRALCTNWEHLLIINDVILANKYLKRFNQMWEQFNDLVNISTHIT